MSDSIVRILITGINGFIGRNLVQKLCIAGAEFIGISIEGSCELSGVKYYEQADITDYYRIASIFEKYRPDVVIHLAAIVHKKSLTADYDTFYRVNFLSSENIFRLCTEYHVQKLLFSSTVEVYDMKAEKVISETSGTLPFSDYGKTKLMAEQALLTLAENTEINFAIMRFSPVYGADFTLNIDRRIYLMKKRIFYYFGSGDYFFNMCSIHNVVHFVRAFIKEDCPSGIYNISDTKNYSVKELIVLEKKKLSAMSQRKASFCIRLLYCLTYIAIAIIQEILKIINKKSVFTINNFRKIFQCAIFDNKKSAGIAGDFMEDVVSTLYGGGMEYEENT
jgi:nucleoside-diphosphate-sugar epimerase